MKIKHLSYILLFVLLGGCLNNNRHNNNNNNNNNNNTTGTMMEEEPRVTGIGGIFFKSENPAQLNQWYYKNLGLAENDYGSMFEFREAADPEKTAYLQWSPFSEKTDYFKPSEKEFMINYRVANIEGMVKILKENGVTILDSIEEFEYGKFIHIMDPEGNKIELWEPADAIFTKMYEGKTTR